jgi:hypothetical protein
MPLEQLQAATVHRRPAAPETGGTPGDRAYRRAA